MFVQAELHRLASNTDCKPSDLSTPSVYVSHYRSKKCTLAISDMPKVPWKFTQSTLNEAVSKYLNADNVFDCSYYADVKVPY